MHLGGKNIPLLATHGITPCGLLWVALAYIIPTQEVGPHVSHSCVGSSRFPAVCTPKGRPPNATIKRDPWHGRMR